MHRPTWKLAAALAGTCAGLAWGGGPRASAHISFGRCGHLENLACGHLTVPLDPSGRVPRAITLALRRHRAPVEGASSAIVALAGGPGQAALPFTNDFLEVLGPAAATRDLIVFDQRGTGLSHPLRCKAFRRSSRLSLGRAISRCASQLGPQRSLFTTAQSVADIEAIRVAGNYEKLVLYATSYGTKVALEYAQRYPEHVEAMVLDSVVPASGPEPLHLTTIAAIPRILRQLCSRDACSHITRNPIADLGALLRQMRRGPLHGRVINRDGIARQVRIRAGELFGVLVGGDLDPVLRSEFPAAVHSAVHGDTAALARLLAEGSGAEAAEGSLDVPLYFATSCEDQTFPWSASSSPLARLHEAATKIQSLPRGSTGPFSAASVLALSDIPACAFWPNRGLLPAPSGGALPNVPTLILSGADDLRTPTADARAVAAQIPDAHLLVVPDTGHAVLGTEPTECAQRAVRAFFARRPIKRCRTRPLPAFLRPTALAPARLSDVRPERGYVGRTGRTLGAVLLSIHYFARTLVTQLGELLQGGSLLESRSLRSGGLRAGWAAVHHGRLVFHGYSYVPGVMLTGFLSSKRAQLRITGRAAARGALTLGFHGALVGMLGGHAIDLPKRQARALHPSSDAVTAGVADALASGRNSPR